MCLGCLATPRTTLQKSADQHVAPTSVPYPHGSLWLPALRLTWSHISLFCNSDCGFLLPVFPENELSAKAVH